MVGQNLKVKTWIKLKLVVEFEKLELKKKNVPRVE